MADIESHPDRPIDEADPGLSGWEDPMGSLRQALDKDELQVFCQPILALQDTPRAYPMAEVLVRLREEEESLLPPGDFLPVFEHFRMMGELDRWVARKTVEWLAEARPGSIESYSVNVSSQSLEDGKLPEFVQGMLARCGLRPELLCMEIDEVDTLQRPDAVERFAAAMHATGCRVVIDGFARRSVSFAPLMAIKPDFVKVDGAIVRKMVQSSVAQLKMKAIVRVCAVAGIGTIAECVEDEDIMAQLKGLRVGYAQGFGIAVPRPIDVGGFPPA